MLQPPLVDTHSVTEITQVDTWGKIPRGKNARTSAPLIHSDRHLGRRRADAATTCQLDTRFLSAALGLTRAIAAPIQTALDVQEHSQPQRILGDWAEVLYKQLRQSYPNPENSAFLSEQRWDSEISILRTVTGARAPTTSIMFPAVRFAYNDLTNLVSNKMKGDIGGNHPASVRLENHIWRWNLLYSVNLRGAIVPSDLWRTAFQGSYHHV
jgi:hypothetical protein